MIIEAKIKQTNIDKDHSRIDAFNPRFRFRPLISLNIKYKNRPIKFFTEWNDIPDGEITINGSKGQHGGNLIRGMIVCRENDDAVYIHMPEQLIK